MAEQLGSLVIILLCQMKGKISSQVNLKDLCLVLCPRCKMLRADLETITVL